MRLRRPDHDILVLLEEYDREVFGTMGLRVCDLAMVAKAGAFYLALAGDAIVGACQLMRVFDEPAFCWVVGFYVRPAWQGRGIGRLLLRQVEDECRSVGLEGMLLTVSMGNTGAMALYRGAGFVEEAFVPCFYGEGEDRSILRRRFGEGGLPGSV
jgi:ribosomal protein S18 acetylase RimI-like enzyme